MGLIRNLLSASWDIILNEFNLKVAFYLLLFGLSVNALALSGKHTVSHKFTENNLTVNKFLNKGKAGFSVNTSPRWFATIISSEGPLEVGEDYANVYYKLNRGSETFFTNGSKSGSFNSATVVTPGDKITTLFEGDTEAGKPYKASFDAHNLAHVIDYYR